MSRCRGIPTSEGTAVLNAACIENGTAHENRATLIKRNGVWKIELLQTDDATTGSR